MCSCWRYEIGRNPNLVECPTILSIYHSYRRRGSCANKASRFYRVVAHRTEDGGVAWTGAVWGRACGLAVAEGALGDTYTDEQRYAEAIPLREHALEHTRESGDGSRALAAEGVLGLVVLAAAAWSLARSLLT